jgi:alginate O-acetyltransferase complex protein AlgI
VLILVVMKYLPFLSENLQAVSILFSLDTHIQPIKAFVAIGVSYYVFQAISYLFDIYLEIEKPERHFGYLALYLSFFPKLLQGPIERAGDLIPQLKARYEFNYDNMRFGILLFTWGLFKKVVIADRLGLYADAVYNDVHAYSGLPLLLGTYAYALQIYMDFSGYTDMALGSARLFNINLTQNFNSPYLATSVADFWRRWHISFSRWILDYIFKPLQMQWRNGRSLGTAAALIVTFLISGIWHGANWGYVIWGGLHGLFMACSVLYKPYQKRLHKALWVEKTRFLKFWQVFVTFNMVSFAWVFFRAKTVGDATTIVKRVLTETTRDVWNLAAGVVSHVPLKDLFKPLLLGQSKNQLVIIFATIILVAFLQNRLNSITNLPTACRWGFYYALLAAVLFLGAFNSGTRFIYVQF